MEQTEIKINFNQIPEFLRGFHNWVNWDPKKTPLNPAGGPASTTDKATWGRFDQAKKIYELSGNGSIAGIGFVFTNTPCTGVDLDKCRNPETGEVEPWAKEIVDHFNSYTEISPSGTGLHIIVHGKLPENSTRRREGNIEVYDTGRYFTITGDSLQGCHADVEMRQGKLDSFYQKYFPEKEAEKQTDPLPQVSSPPLTDDEIIRLAMTAKNSEKFGKLFLEGDITGYPSQSEAEGALITILDFYTQDPEQKKRLMNQSAFKRDKWDTNKTYLDRTIKTGVASEHYKPKTEPIINDKKSEMVSTESLANDQNDLNIPCKVNWGHALRLWIIELGGESYTLDQFYKEHGVKDSYDMRLIRNNNNYLLKTKFIERLGHAAYIQIDNYAPEIELDNIDQGSLDIKWPCGCEHLIDIFPGSIIVQAGETDGGKTTHSLVFAYDNRDHPLGPIHFFCAERPEQLINRVKKSKKINLAEFKKIKFHERYDNFQHVIVPGGINIIDWLEAPNGEYNRMEFELTRIDKVIRQGKGLCLVNIQKDKGAFSDYGHGGPKTANRAQLYLTLRNNPDYSGHSIKITKGKGWRSEKQNPNGLVRQYKIHGGIDLEFLSEWHTGGEERPAPEFNLRRRGHGKSYIN